MLFDTIFNKIQQAMETSKERRSGFTHESVGLLYYHLQRIDIRSKKVTINPKNEKENECFKWSIIAGLYYNRSKKKN